MKLFNKIEGGVAVIRKGNGVWKQVDLYSYGEQVFIKEAGGFIKIMNRLSSTEPYLTVHPAIKVVEFNGDGVKVTNNNAPEFKIGWK